MLHTWQNATYLADLNFGKSLEKVWKKFGKSKKDLVFSKMTGRLLE
jgi:hypothetical protein